MFDLVDEVLIVFNGLDDDGCVFVVEYGVFCIGLEENIGILGGFKMFVDGMILDIVLLFENDLFLIESVVEVYW